MINPLRLRSNPERTAKRLRELHSYLDKNVLAGRNFVCKKCGACKDSLPNGIEFHTGQLHHVGLHYDLQYGRKDVRILVMGQSSGGHDKGVSLGRRRRDIIWCGENCQIRKGKGSEGKRNLHMTGTTVALRLILGLGLKNPERHTEYLTLQRQSVHIFQAFALVNFLLCSATDGKHNGDRSTGEMRENCSKHLRKVLEILEPTIIVAQGTGRWLAENGLCSSGDYGKETVPSGAVLLKFPHPSARHPDLCWGDVGRKYLLRNVKPTIERVVGQLFP